MMRMFFVTILLACLFCGESAFGFGEQHDERTLLIKGFSFETAQPVQHQIARMEGRYPDSAPTFLRQAYYNFYNGLWLEPLQPFTYDVLDPPPLPKRLLKKADVAH